MENGQGGREPGFSHARVYGKADVNAAIVKWTFSQHAQLRQLIWSISWGHSEVL